MLKPTPGHLRGEPAQFLKVLLDPPGADHGPPALLDNQQALGAESLEGLPHRHLAHAEFGGAGTLGKNDLPRFQLGRLDHGLYLVADLAVIGT